MRGEDVVCGLCGCGAWGSPPHARGRLRLRFSQLIDTGITPACAGKTFPDSSPTPDSPDHPRMRGEDRLRLSVGAECGGSPPHARGRLGSAPAREPSRRITPACAGKTVRSRLTCTMLRDHPRMRGEDGTWMSGGRGGCRITPACAGKTQTPARNTGQCPDHPRMRGEDAARRGAEDR